MVHFNSDEKSTSRIKNPVSTPTCSACFKPETRKKDKCADFRSHVSESELSHCFAFIGLVKPNVTTTDTVPICESLPSHFKDKSESSVGLKLKKEHGLCPNMPLPSSIVAIVALGKHCIISKRQEMSFTLFVSPPGFKTKECTECP